MKKLLFSLVILLAMGVSLSAGQLNPAPSSTGSISTNAANCFTTNACIVLHMAASNVGYSVTVSGTWTGTLTVEQSGDNQGSWTSATTTTGNTLFTSALTPGITDVRVRGSAAMTGTAVVTITASGPATLQQITQTGGSSVSPNTPVPAASQQGPAYNVKNYGAVGDAKKTLAAVTGNGSSTITDATNSPFLAGDAGKKIYCIGLNGNSALTTTIATITVFNSASSITVNTTGNGNAQNPSICVWFTQKDTAAMIAAGTDAKQTLSTKISNIGPTLAYPGNVFCPPGGYVVDGPFFSQVVAGGNGLGVSFIGAGRGSCTIYISPDVAVSNNSWILNTVSTNGVEFSGFTVDCATETLGVTAPGMRFNAVNGFIFRNVSILGCGTTGDAVGLVQFNSIQNAIVDGVTVNNTGMSTATPSNEPQFVMTGGFNVHIRNWYTTNPGVGAQIVQSGGQTFAGGPRSTVGGAVVIEDSVFDEGAVPAPLQISTGSSVVLIGVSLFEGLGSALTVDGNSSVYINESNLVPFGGSCSGGNRNALVLSSGAFAMATGSSFSGCGSNGAGLSAAISGPVGATFVSAGGNDIRNCPGGPPCALVTAANYATLGFAGGIVPKSSETHTPNTCYVTGTFGATTAAAPMCASFSDQNYQIIRIKAASTTVTACATPPVVTISDGVQSATLTLTTAKSIWDSAVDSSSGINSIFATGNTIVASNTAGTCATPPTNFSVTMTLQSVINP